METTVMTLEEARKVFPTLHSKEIIAHKRKVISVAWNATGRKLASSSLDCTAKVWNFETPYTTFKDLELKGHTESVDQLCWNPQNDVQLATASTDKTVKIWDVRTGKCIESILTTGENINISWSPDGNMIAVGNKSDELCIVDTRKSKIVKSVQFHYEVNEIAWNHDGSLLLSTTGQGSIDILKLPDLKVLKILQGHTANIYCIKFDPTGRFFAVGSADSLVSLWDCTEMICLRAFSNLEWPVRTLGFSCDGKFIASASEDLVIDISHVETGEHVYSVQCDTPMNSLAWHPKEYYLASAGDDRDKYSKDCGTIKIFGFK